MLLTEFEAKKILQTYTLLTPAGVLLTKEDLSTSMAVPFSYPVVLKAQVLHGNRGLSGLILFADSAEELSEKAAQLFAKSDAYGNPIDELLIEEKCEFESQVYISLGYDTSLRSLICRYSSEGGAGMDERGSTLQEIPLSVVTGPTVFEANPKFLPLVKKIWQAFIENDALLLEINPVGVTSSGYVCLDAKIELEDAARFRHPEWNASRLVRAAGEKRRTPLEQAALAISRQDERGVAGESFFEFPGGTIGVLASGGGASALAMDGLLEHGLQPANYTEYSGNPSRDKVRELTELVLSIQTLEALYVVGSNASFTDIFETLSGVVDGLLASNWEQQFPVIIRRGGPRWEEAFEMVRTRLDPTRFAVTLLGPTVPILDTIPALKTALVKRQHSQKERV